MGRKRKQHKIWANKRNRRKPYEIKQEKIHMEQKERNPFAYLDYTPAQKDLDNLGKHLMHANVPSNARDFTVRKQRIKQKSHIHCTRPCNEFEPSKYSSEICICGRLREKHMG
jgi:hypothetical protein